MDEFLIAFNEATAKEKAAQKAAGATANINQETYTKCVQILQKYANGQLTEWDPKDLDTLLKLLNDAGFSDKALQKVNPILNAAKKSIAQNKPAETPAKTKPTDGQQPTNGQPADGGNAAGTTGATTDAAQPAPQISDALKVEADAVVNKLGKEGANIDSLIAYLQSKKQ